MSTENPLAQKIAEEKAWFVDHDYSHEQLLEVYKRVVEGIDDHAETLDRGNAARLTAYYAKKQAIEEMIPEIIKGLEE